MHMLIGAFGIWAWAHTHTVAFATERILFPYCFYIMSFISCTACHILADRLMFFVLHTPWNKAYLILAGLLIRWLLRSSVSWSGASFENFSKNASFVHFYIYASPAIIFYLKIIKWLLYFTSLKYKNHFNIILAHVMANSLVITCLEIYFNKTCIQQEHYNTKLFS